MAKLTALEIMNLVLDNNGLAQLANLSNLTKINLRALNKIDEVLMTVAASDFWRPQETTGTITIVTATQTYTEPSDFMKADKNSFNYNYNHHLKYLDSQEVDDLTLNLARTGTPRNIYEIGTSFYVDPIPTSTDNGDTIYYRYWKLPSKIDVTDPTGTTWFPEPFGRTVLVSLATAELMASRGGDMAVQSRAFYEKVYGIPGRTEGTLQMMQKNFRSPSLYRTPVRIKL